MYAAGVGSFLLTDSLFDFPFLFLSLFLSLSLSLSFVLNQRQSVIGRC